MIQKAAQRALSFKMCSESNVRVEKQWMSLTVDISRWIEYLCSTGCNT